MREHGEGAATRENYAAWARAQKIPEGKAEKKPSRMCIDLADRVRFVCNNLEGVLLESVSIWQPSKPECAGDAAI